MLSYLAATLPAGTSPEARLLALQCALRADRQGQVQLPVGLLRGMRLAHTEATWQELKHRQWLDLVPQTLGLAPVAAQLRDPITHSPGRPDRHRAADWAARVTSRPSVRSLPATARLAALALAAHYSRDCVSIGTEADRLARACGIKPARLSQVLNYLATAGVLIAWTCDARTEVLDWTLSREIHTVV